MDSPDAYVEAVFAGLRQAVDDAGSQRHPSDKELVDLLEPSDDTNRVALAGYAYSAATSLMHQFPGPAILLCGAALDGMGSAPRTDLMDAFKVARSLLKERGLLESAAIVAVLDAATSLAGFHKVQQKLENEFAQGLRSSKTYSEKDIARLVPAIIDVTHTVRHKGLVQRFSVRPSDLSEFTTAWTSQPKPEYPSSDISYFPDPTEFTISRDPLPELAIAARRACANQIFDRLESRRSHS